MRSFATLVLLLGLAGPAVAFTDADRSAVQGVIEQQLSAFSHDDGATAYSLAGAGIKQMFPSPDVFMSLVKQGYGAVYRQKSHAFGLLEDKDGSLVQSVDIVDMQSEEWTAVYTLTQDSDGSWKINGCFLVKKPGVSA